MFIDLKETLAKEPNENIQLIAVERLYPFPRKTLKSFRRITKFRICCLGSRRT